MSVLIVGGGSSVATPLIYQLEESGEDDITVATRRMLPLPSKIPVVDFIKVSGYFNKTFITKSSLDSHDTVYWLAAANEDAEGWTAETAEAQSRVEAEFFNSLSNQQLAKIIYLGSVQGLMSPILGKYQGPYGRKKAAILKTMIDRNLGKYLIAGGFASSFMSQTVEEILKLSILIKKFTRAKQLPDFVVAALEILGKTQADFQTQTGLGTPDQVAAALIELSQSDRQLALTCTD